MRKELFHLWVIILPLSFAFAQERDTTMHIGKDSLIYQAHGKQYTGVAGLIADKKELTLKENSDLMSQHFKVAFSNRFPKNTLVRVVNSRNGKSVDVKVAGRLSKSGTNKDWLIELSKQAVKQLAYNKRFIFKVKIQKIDIIAIKSDDYKINIDSSLAKDTLNWLDEITGKNYRKTGKIIKGIASFYSANLDGTKTATGEIFRNSKYTAASNNLKLNTLVLVTNLKNKKSVVVRINDRMHPRMAKKGRVVDLSRIAAKTLDFIENGLTKVSVETILVMDDQNLAVPGSKRDSMVMRGPDELLKKDSLLKDSLPAPENLRTDSSVTGLAGIYSAGSEGAKMVNGGLFHHKKLMGAANQFKLNAWVKLTNLKNNKTVILKITDHISKAETLKGFVIELSRAAARAVDLNSKGHQMVKIEKLNR